MNRAPDAPPAGHEPAAPRPDHVPEQHPRSLRSLSTTFGGGFLMGSADIVPGVSGGTVALVIGIYERLVTDVRQGARALSLLGRGDLRGFVEALRHVEWAFLIALLGGILTAVALLAGGLEHLLDTQPVYLSAGFTGLIVGSVAVAATELEERTPRLLGVAVVAAVATFLLLGLRSGQIDDPTLAVFFVAGALAVCAMILPGVSGSFILLMIGLYEAVLGAVNDRDVVVLAVVAAGAAVGLGAFSTFLNWLLRRYRDVVLAALIGLMAGSLRVLWPWPAGEDGVGDVALGAPVASEIPLALLFAVVGAVVVVAVAGLARALGRPAVTAD